MLQGRLKGVSREYSVVSRIYERNSKRILEKSQGCFSRKFQVCSNTVFKVHQGSFKKVSSVFQGRLKGVSMEL